ncbi:hypothetical protein [Micromonospora sp. DT229]|uniref:hypothetical protein n=1 Tax=Micromonospora sp. DT229 TaxID=3393430 RepID=UPI003CEA7F83
MEEQTAAMRVSARYQEAVRFLVTHLLLLVPYLSTAAVTYVISLATISAPGQHLWLGYMLMGVLVMVLATTWGWLTGRHLSPVFSALVALLTWFLFLAYVSDRAEFIASSGPPWRTPDMVVMLLRAAAVALLLVVVVATPKTFEVSPTRPRVQLLPGVALALVVVSILGQKGIVDRPPPQQALCLPDRIVVCLWPEHEKFAPMIKDMVARAEGLPDGFVLPARLHEYGTQVIDTPAGRQQIGDLDISEGRASALAVGMSTAITSTTFEGCDWDAMSEKNEHTPDALRRWMELHLTETAAPDYTTFGAPEQLHAAWALAAQVYTERSPQEQQTWVTTEIIRIRHAYCG